jgi:hypothetical protein
MTQGRFHFAARIDCARRWSNRMLQVPTVRSEEMVRPAGLEPATLGSEDRCSIQLSHGRALRIIVLGL